MLSHFTSAVNTGQARQERQDTAIECLAQAWLHIEAETGQSSPIVARNSLTIALATAMAMAIAIARARASFNDAKTNLVPAPEVVGTVGPMAFCAKHIAALLEKAGLSRPRVKL